MGLLSKLFGGKDNAEAASGPSSSQFHESESTTGQLGDSRNAPRRELIHVVLRDTMRKHGIPSDWMDCRVLSVVSRKRADGMHVQLVVRQGHDELLTYVYAFQEAFLRELQRFEPRAEEWLMSLSWQFEGTGSQARSMPDPDTWASASAPAAAHLDAQETQPLEDDVAEDLKALFAIRDAALKDAGTVRAAPPAASALDDFPEFQPTRPGFGDSNDDRR